MTVNELVRFKLTDDEKARLREINKKREEERMASVARIRVEAAPLLAELHAVGLKIKSVGDLIGRAERYEAAIPILLKHLQMPYSDVIKETIARSLAVPEPAVMKAWPMLVDEYRNAPMGWGIKGPGDTKEFRLGAKDGLACALSIAVTNETMEELIDLVKDRTQGESRILLLSALRKSSNPLAQQAIEELSSDPDLAKEIASWRTR
ncbi:hypothetical protein GCN74_09145 [Janthinobacterium sp. FT14W]|uniref:hypothetical protein n=1 Tax=Janthinobacterium sp. FT14W TaxID=2654253 RepID=UPI001264DE10|nr:hypothetical protein [Janthinobacterium sp. FT14W]KAB8060432.1 hypothetical protein GCN74_09145 [Janthinobacterium sp. FT14W]